MVKFATTAFAVAILATPTLAMGKMPESAAFPAPHATAHRVTAPVRVAANSIQYGAQSQSSAASAPSASSASLTPESLAQRIRDVGAPDLTYAIALATAAGTPQAKVRLQCYQAMQSAFPAPPAGAVMPPEPHLVTNVEELAEIIDGLQPTSSIFVNCAGAAQLAQLNVLQFINAVVTGAAGAAILVPKL